MTSMIRREDNKVSRSIGQPSHTLAMGDPSRMKERVVRRLSLEVPEELTNRRSGKRVGDWLFVDQPRALDPLSLAAMPLLQTLAMRPELSESGKPKRLGKKGGGEREMGSGI